MITSNAPQIRSAPKQTADAARLEKLRENLVTNASKNNGFDEDQALVRLESETGLTEPQAEIMTRLFDFAESLRIKGNGLFELALSRPDLTEAHQEAVDTLVGAQLKNPSAALQQALEGPEPTETQGKILNELRNEDETQGLDRLFTGVLANRDLTPAHAEAVSDVLDVWRRELGDKIANVDGILARPEITKDQGEMIDVLASRIRYAQDFKSSGDAVKAVLANPTFSPVQKDLMKHLIDESDDKNSFNEVKAFVAVAGQPGLTKAKAQRLEAMFNSAQPAPPSGLWDSLWGTPNYASEVNTKPFLALLEG